MYRLWFSHVTPKAGMDGDLRQADGNSAVTLIFSSILYNENNTYVILPFSTSKHVMR